MNLWLFAGAKFGGYGSFLPTYQRSPVGPHPKTPLKLHAHSAPESPNPNNVHIEVLLFWNFVSYIRIYYLVP